MNERNKRYSEYWYGHPELKNRSEEDWERERKYKRYMWNSYLEDTSNYIDHKAEDDYSENSKP